MSDVSLTAAPLPLPGGDVSESEQLEEKPVLTEWESLLQDLLQHQVYISNASGSFSLQRLIMFVFSPTFRINSPISDVTCKLLTFLCGEKKGPAPKTRSTKRHLSDMQGRLQGLLGDLAWPRI